VSLPSPGVRDLSRLLRAPLFWILLAAAALRAAFFWQTRGNPLATAPLWDAAIYDQMARSVAAGHGIGFDRAYFFGPLYPYALGLLYAVTRSCASCAIAAQHALGVALCGLTYALGRRWLGRGAGLLAAGLLASSGLEIFFEGQLLMEVLVSALLATSMLLLSPADAPAPSRLFLAGALLGLAALGRPSLLLLAPLVLVPLRATRRSGRAVVAALAAFAAGLALPPAATFVRNLRAEGAPIVVTSSGGFNFYAGNSRNSNGMFLDDMQVKADLSWNGEDTAETALRRDLRSDEVSRYWRDRALAEIREDPPRWVRLLFRKLQIFLNGQDVPQIEWFTYERRRWAVLRYASLDPRVLMGLAVAGMLALLPRARRLALLYGIVALGAAGIALFFVTTRYRVPLLPYFCLFAAAFLHAAVSAARARSWRKLGLLALAGVAAWAFTSPARFPVDRTKALYAQLLHDGFRLTKARRFDEAVHAYSRARELWPDDYECRMGLGVAYREKGDLARSLAELLDASARHPVDAELPYQLGVTLQKLGRTEEAERALRESLRSGPRRGATYAYLGLNLAAQGRFDEARAALERGLALDPAQPFALDNLGALLGLLGDEAGARRSFLAALAVDESYAPARLNLAKSYLAAGDLASAARELRRLARESPDDAEAASLLRDVERRRGAARGPTRGAD
jgi:Flp pilus assembly protein TadD